MRRPFFLALTLQCVVATNVVGAGEELANYHSLSTPMKKSLSEAQAALLSGFEICQPNGWVVTCKEAEGVSTCVVTTSDPTKPVGKVDFIALGQQTQVVISILKSYPVPTQVQSVRQWLHFVEGRARDVCPTKP